MKATKDDGESMAWMSSSKSAWKLADNQPSLRSDTPSAVTARQWSVSRLQAHEHMTTSRSLLSALDQQGLGRNTKVMKMNGPQVKSVNPWRKSGIEV